MQRITIAVLQALVDQINRESNTPPAPYTEVDGKHIPAIGNYHLSQAYGGVCLLRMVGSSGGVTAPLMQGHVTKRECYTQLTAFLAGVRSAIEQKEI